MSGTFAGAQKRRETMIARYGSVEAWKAAMREIASKGGRAPRRATKKVEGGA